MSVRVYLQQGEKEVRVSGGCYGCLGRADSCMVNKDVRQEFEDYQGRGSGKRTTVFRESKISRPEVCVIRKPESGQVYANERIFDPMYREWYEFLYNSEVFGLGLPHPDCLDQGEICISCNIPADEFITTLFLLRAPEDYMGCTKVYSLIKDLPLNDTVKLIFSLGMHPLACGTTGASFNLNRQDGTMFMGMTKTSMKRIINGHIPSQAPCTYEQAGAYPMMVINRWGEVQRRGFDDLIREYWDQGDKFPLSRIQGEFLDLPSSRTLGDPEDVRSVVMDTVQYLLYS